jgi:hypothetical protein
MKRKRGIQYSSGWAWESQKSQARRERPLERPATVTRRDTLETVMPDLEADYRASKNLALVIEALRYCAVGDTCPAWVADALSAWLQSESPGRGPVGQWWRRHQKDLIDLQRYWAVEEGRRMGLSRTRAGDYASDRLASTPAAAQPSQHLDAHKRVVRQQTATPGRYLLTTLDRSWLAQNFPHSPSAATRYSQIDIRYRQSLGRPRGKSSPKT